MSAYAALDKYLEKEEEEVVTAAKSNVARSTANTGFDYAAALKPADADNLLQSTVSHLNQLLFVDQEPFLLSDTTTERGKGSSEGIQIVQPHDVIEEERKVEKDSSEKKNAKKQRDEYLEESVHRRERRYNNEMQNFILKLKAAETIRKKQFDKLHRAIELEMALDDCDDDFELSTSSTNFDFLLLTYSPLYHLVIGLEDDGGSDVLIETIDRIDTSYDRNGDLEFDFTVEGSPPPQSFVDYSLTNSKRSPLEIDTHKQQTNVTSMSNLTLTAKSFKASKDVRNFMRMNELEKLRKTLGGGGVNDSELSDHIDATRRILNDEDTNISFSVHSPMMKLPSRGRGEMGGGGDTAAPSSSSSVHEVDESNKYLHRVNLDMTTSQPAAPILSSAIKGTSGKQINKSVTFSFDDERENNRVVINENAHMEIVDISDRKNVYKQRGYCNYINENENVGEELWPANNSTIQVNSNFDFSSRGPGRSKRDRGDSDRGGEHESIMYTCIDIPSTVCS